MNARVNSLLSRWPRWIPTVAVALLWLLLSASVMAMLLQLPESGLVQAVQRVQSVMAWGIVLQIAAIAWAMLNYRRMVAWGRRKGIVSRREHRQVLASRPKVAAFLLAYLVLIPIGPDAIYRFIVQLF